MNLPPSTQNVSAGMVEALPLDECRAVGDGRAIVVRTNGGVVAFTNRCLHQDSPLAGGWIRDGVLTCPLHFWRYRVDDGTLVGGSGRGALERLPVVIDAGEVMVEVTVAPAPRSLRDQLLERARTYDRGAAHATRNREPPDD